MQESPHVRHWIHPTGFVGLAVLVWIAAELVGPLFFILQQGGQFGQFMDPLIFTVFVFGPAGWAGLVYVCCIRSGRITGTALAFVLALGVCGMLITHLAPGFPFEPFLTVVLTGTWILNGLVIVWIVQRVRRIRAASNTDAGDAAR